MAVKSLTKKVSSDSVLIFYIVWVTVLVLEVSIVKGILYTSNHLIGINWLGFYLAWFLFATGGLLFSFLTLRSAKVDQELRDPLLKAGHWVHRKSVHIGFVYNSLINGALGTAIILKKIDHPNAKALCIASALLFATVWVPIFMYVHIPT